MSQCEFADTWRFSVSIANVLEDKIAKGFVSEATAREIADRIMLENGKAFYRLG